ncbi:transcriptional regulator with XRE-family HTH domain [Saccharothrix tamanrassetensis]|uniref:Transcriptional regulator with XRE-family HTH domain n=1 Tax=Saccharothrix tamanrassetensis TaxID=1051531 RepID=A0A841CT70_9PSEU|nr:helix-turn-helix transcriptional regulator [Saccharothrix tamanrassetensis]MBB5960063.1 transcriptional regulator with XRE-family HTH domain [Saccharothrix tamanrassetensis]
MASSAIAAAWELGLRLREHRDQLGLSVGGTAKAVRMQQPNLSAVETGRKKITEANLLKLGKLFELADEEIGELSALRARAEQRDWYHRYSWLFNEDFLRYLGFEFAADTLRVYESCFVPGPLQTVAYATETMTTGSPYNRLTEVEPRVEARLARRVRLEGDDPIGLSILLSEAVLRQQIGGPEVMRDQLDHLASMADQVEIRVLPFSAGGYSALGGSFYVLTFPSPHLPGLVYQETLTSTTLLERRQQVREYTVAFAESANQALSPADSLAFIRGIAKEMK